MALQPRAGPRAAALFWLGALLAAALALQRPAPLFVNLGAGDAAFARGFRGGWERDGLRGSGETMFRWTLDGSRLELPVSVVTGNLAARLRLARFAPGAADVAVQAGGQERDRWTQPSQGWRVRDLALGDARGPLVLSFRSQSGDSEGLGVALDWVEITGAHVILPSEHMMAGLALLFLALPVLVAVQFRSASAGLIAGALLLVLATSVLLMDRLGGLVGLSRAGAPAVLALILLAIAARALKTELRAAWIPAAAVVIALVALSHPFYYYPDVDTHARYLAAARADPGLFLDAREFQMRTGAWTRDVAGRRVAFPYSSAFHVLSWPVALFLGEEAAVKWAAVIALGLTVLLVHALARLLGLGPMAYLLAQALVVLLPVTASRLTLALFPTLLGQALELLLIVALARMFPPAARRSAWALGALLVLAQAAYTGSLLNVGLTVLVFVTLASAAGEWRGALRLLALYAVAALVVVAVQYARFLPVLWHDVLPHAGQGPAYAETDSAGPVARALRRLGLFYDVVDPLLLVPVIVAVRRAPAAARRIVMAALLAGLTLLALRYAAPAVFRDAKEVELMAAPVAVLAAAGAAWLWRRGRPGQAAALGALLWAAGWGLMRAYELYAERFVAVGR
jgi:hypothetical protein